MTITTVPQPRTTTPAWQLAREAYHLFFSNVPALLRLIWVWLALVMAVIGALNYFLYPALALAFDEPSITSEIAFVLTTVFTSLAACSINVSWSRFILLGEPLDEAAYLRLDPITQTCFAVSLLLNAMMVLPLLSLTRLVTAPVAPPLWMIGLTGLSILMALWIMVRLAPLYPAIATDADDAGFAEIWIKTDGLTFPLLIGLSLSYLLPITIAVCFAALQPAGFLAAPPQDPWTFAVTSASYEAIWLVFATIPQAFATLAYARINDLDVRASRRRRA